jgi:signal transduction protein with GAF and PtsI domain
MPNSSAAGSIVFEVTGFLLKSGGMSETTFSDASAEGWLGEVMGGFGCGTGTLHKADGEWLDLVVAIGVPESWMPMISRIPFGKGIAGAAAASREPVELCNLQEDLGGVAKEGARQTLVAGSLAVPVFSTDGSEVLGTLGIGKREPHDFSDDEKAELARRAGEVAVAWGTKE